MTLTLLEIAANVFLLSIIAVTAVVAWRMIRAILLTPLDQEVWYKDPEDDDS